MWLKGVEVPDSVDDMALFRAPPPRLEEDEWWLRGVRGVEVL
jgi:hypothetical protein